MCDAKTRLNTPTFIQLFIIARILTQQNINTGDDNIKQLLLKLADVKQRLIAKDILTKIMKDGIKKYMHYHSHENEQIETIDLIYHHMLLIPQFAQEYQNVTRYVQRKNHQKYPTSARCQTSVFNTDDLMCFIFQFMEIKQDFTGDLINCSLVCSHWLYQTWNPNSLYYLNFDWKDATQSKAYHIPAAVSSFTNGSNIKKVNSTLILSASKRQRLVKIQKVTVNIDIHQVINILNYYLQCYQ